MNSITLTASMRSNLMSLKNIAAQMNKTQNILSTGKKVNSAIDNASSYYQARALTNRAADLSALLDSMGQGIQTIQAATEGLTSATTFLEQATAVANQAASKATNIVARVSTEEELLAAVNSGQEGFIVLENDITMSDNQNIVLHDNQSLVGARYFDKNAAQTTLSFNYDMSEDVAVESPITVGNNTIISDLNINFTTNTNNIKNETGLIYSDSKQGLKFQNITINIDKSSSSLAADCAAITMDNSNAEFSGDINIFTVGEYGRGVYLRRSSNVNINDAKVNMNTDMGLISYDSSVININESSYVNLYDRRVNIRLQNNSVININDKSVVNAYSTVTTAITVTADSVIFINNDAIVNVNKNITGITPIMTGNGKLNSSASFDAETTAIFADFEAYMATNVGAEVDRVDAASIGENKQFSDILDEFDKLINDTSYQGVNLLKGADLTVTFNESRSNKFTVSGRDMSAENIGLVTRDWLSKADVETSIKELTSAVDKIRDFQSELGNNYSIIQTRQNFTEALTDVLETGADNLVLADMNEASAEYLMLQTRQQLATNSLSLAAQSAQSVLLLF